jgi:hypothetical protein
MSTFLLLVPAALSLLVLAAHFLRRSEPLPVMLCLAMLCLLFVRRPWASRALQVALLLAAGEWIRTALALVPARRAMGEPWERMAAILGIVAAVALLSALAFELPALRRRHGRPGPRPPETASG